MKALTTGPMTGDFRSKLGRWVKADDEALNEHCSTQILMHEDVGEGCGPTMRVSPSPTASLPQRAGRFQLLEEIARGGMGSVIKAWDSQLERYVAIKLLHRKLMVSPMFIQRFYQEARINGYLEHPSIVSVHEVGVCEDGQPFFVMRLLQGRTLADLLEDGEARDDHHNITNLRMFEKICDGIAYAHSQGVNHRDLKPENILVGDFGVVKIIDWGLANFVRQTNDVQAPDHEAGPSDLDFLDSPPSFVMGTPAYIAPEQARGEVEHLDERVDVFGLGGILCHMLTGECPYPEGNPSKVEQAKSGNLGPAHRMLDASCGDSRVIHLAKQCLSPRPNDRPRDGNEVASTITSYLETPLRRAERDLVRFFDLSLDMFCIAGLEGHFRRVNANFSRILGYADGELLQKPFAEFIHPGDLQATAEAMGALSEGQPVVRFTNRYRHKNGHYLLLEWNAKVETEESGLIYAVARDVTERPGSRPGALSCD